MGHPARDRVLRSNEITSQRKDSLDSNPFCGILVISNDSSYCRHMKIPSVERDITPWGKEVAKSLHLDGGIFIKRRGAIDGGWKIMAERKNENNQDVVIIGKDEQGKAKTRQVSHEELVRLNTGRNRGAFEYLDKIKEFSPLPNLLEAVDRADTDPEARKDLSKFFAKEALKLGSALRPPIKAGTVNELAEKLSATGDHRLEVADTLLRTLPEQQAELREQIAQAKKVGHLTNKQRQELADMIQDEEEVSLQLSGAKGNKRRFEADWHAQIKDILLLIDLTEQFKK